MIYRRAFITGFIFASAPVNRFFRVYCPTVKVTFAQFNFFHISLMHNSYAINFKFDIYSRRSGIAFIRRWLYRFAHRDRYLFALCSTRRRARSVCVFLYWVFFLTCRRTWEFVRASRLTSDLLEPDVIGEGRARTCCLVTVCCWCRCFKIG